MEDSKCLSYLDDTKKAGATTLVCTEDRKGSNQEGYRDECGEHLCLWFNGHG